MIKTREQLKAKGVLLAGPIVPDWFKAQSDGCSVPTRIGRVFLKAKQSRAACYIHDFEYYVAAIDFPDGFGRDVARFQADLRLRGNRKLVARTRFFGWIYGRLYYRAVRLGGARAMKTEDRLAIPPTLKDCEDIKTHLRRELTNHAGGIIRGWERQYDAA